MSRATLPEVREGYFPHWKLKTTGVIMPEERLPWGQTIVSGLQHGVAMAGGTIIAPLIMGFDPNRALLFSGLGTLIFFAVVAGRVPSYLGSSFSFVAVVITASSYSGHGPNLEAIDQFRRGLALVEALSDPGEQADRELDLQMALGPALFATKVFSHPDLGRTYARAWELCRQLDDYSRERRRRSGRRVRRLRRQVHG
jgi:hypothetical protein